MCVRGDIFLSSFKANSQRFYINFVCLSRERASFRTICTRRQSRPCGPLSATTEPQLAAVRG